MPGKNVIQKILAHAAGKNEVATGEYINVRSSRPVTLGGDTMARGPSQMMETGAKKVFDPKMIKIVVGHIRACGTPTAEFHDQEFHRPRGDPPLAGSRSGQNQ